MCNFSILINITDREGGLIMKTKLNVSCVCESVCVRERERERERERA